MEPDDRDEGRRPPQPHEMGPGYIPTAEEAWLLDQAMKRVGWTPVEELMGRAMTVEERFDVLMVVHGKGPYMISAMWPLKQQRAFEGFMSEAQFDAEARWRENVIVSLYKDCGKGVSGAKCRVAIKSAALEGYAESHRQASIELREGLRALRGSPVEAASYWVTRVALGKSHDTAVQVSSASGLAAALFQAAYHHHRASTRARENQRNAGIHVSTQNRTPQVLKVPRRGVPAPPGHPDYRLGMPGAGAHFRLPLSPAAEKLRERLLKLRRR